MTQDIWLLHIHNTVNEVYDPYWTQAEAIQALAEYIRFWWDKEVSPKELISDPLTREDAEFYCSETGEWANVVHVYKVGVHLASEVLSPEEVWGQYAAR